MDEDKMVIVKEDELGTAEMTADLESSYLESCKRNNTTPDDMKYFRAYIWNIIAMLVLKVEDK